jgi:hypothetical protein
MRPVKVFAISLLRGQSVLLTVHCEQNGLQEPSLSPMKRYVTKHAKARQRRRLQAQRAAEARHQAIEALGLPENLVAEIEGR